MRKDFDIEGKQPLRSAVDKDHEVNADSSMNQLDDELKAGKRKKLWIGIGISIALIVTVVVLVLVLTKKNNPRRFDQGTILNPYTLAEDSQRAQFSARYYNLFFDKTIVDQGSFSIVNFTKRNYTDS